MHGEFVEALKANDAVQPGALGKLLAHVKKPNLKKALNLKKARRKERENIKGKVIDGKHEQYVLTLGMMMGIRQTLCSRANAGDLGGAGAAHKPLALDDFGGARKYVFPPRGTAETPPHSLAHTFKFKDYAPRAFAAIRSVFGVSQTDYITSVCGTQYFLNFISNSKSQQYFFYSHDGKFLIKTQTRDEVRFLRKMLPAYYAHLKAHPGSLLTRFLGMSRIKFYHLRRKVRFVVMMSVHPTPLHVHTTYDLKGCTHGRRTTAKERDRDARLGIGLHLKDLDLLDDGFRLCLAHRGRDAFLSQLRLDVAFLAERSIMDYSLLIGVHDPSRTTFDAWDGTGEDGAKPSVADVEAASGARLSGPAAPPAAPSVVDLSCGLLGGAAPDPAAALGSPKARRAPDDDDDASSDDDADASLTGAEATDAAHALKRAIRASPDGGGLVTLTRGRRDLGIPSRPERGAIGPTYFLGVIDILIKYNAKKSAETYFKSLRAPRSAISSIPPDEYAARFIAFVEDHVLTPEGA